MTVCGVCVCHGGESYSFETFSLILSIMCVVWCGVCVCMCHGGESYSFETYSIILSIMCVVCMCGVRVYVLWW